MSEPKDLLRQEVYGELGILKDEAKLVGRTELVEALRKASSMIRGRYGDKVFRGEFLVACENDMNGIANAGGTARHFDEGLAIIFSGTGDGKVRVEVGFAGEQALACIIEPALSLGSDRGVTALLGD